MDYFCGIVWGRDSTQDQTKCFFQDKEKRMDRQNERIRIKDIATRSGVSVGTVDRVLHGRPGVSEASRQKVEEILKELDYQPNVYASALASNRRYLFACIVPQHDRGEYWSDVENGFDRGAREFSDFNVSIILEHYDQYRSGSFTEAANSVLQSEPDAVVISPSVRAETVAFVDRLQEKGIPYVFIDSNIPELKPFCFFGQNAEQSGFFAARMMNLLAGAEKEIVVFRLIYEGRLGSDQQIYRENGFYRYINEHAPGLRIWELNLNAKEPEMSHLEIDYFLLRHPNVKHGITFSSRAYLVGEYMTKNNIKDFHLIGYDLLERNVACLREGTIDFIITQQPTLQGFSCIEALCDNLIMKKPVEPVNYMPITLLSIENVESYLNVHKKDYSQLVKSWKKLT